jgi:EpsI family protein
LLLFAILAAGSAYTLTWRPADAHNSIDGLVETSRAVPGWSILRDIEMDYKRYTALDPNSLIFRDYRNEDGNIVNLAVVYHQNDRWGAHDPTICYKSQGWTVSPLQEAPSVEVDGRRIDLDGFVVKKGTYTSLVYYFWFSSRDKLVASRTRQMVDMVVSGLVRGYTESGFVRFSIGFSPFDRERKSETLKDFVEEFVHVLQADG